MQHTTIMCLTLDCSFGLERMLIYRREHTNLTLTPLATSNTVRHLTMVTIITALSSVRKKKGTAVTQLSTSPRKRLAVAMGLGIDPALVPTTYDRRGLTLSISHIANWSTSCTVLTTDSLPLIIATHVLASMYMFMATLAIGN